MRRCVDGIENLWRKLEAAHLNPVPVQLPRCPACDEKANQQTRAPARKSGRTLGAFRRTHWSYIRGQTTAAIPAPKGARSPQGKESEHATRLLALALASAQ